MSILGSPVLLSLWSGKGYLPRLPEGYTEVEYIETDGTAYIDTGIGFSGNAMFELEMLYAGTDGHIFGTTNDVHGMRFLISAAYEDNTSYTFYGTNAAGTGFSSYRVGFQRPIANEMIRTRGVMKSGYFAQIEDKTLYGSTVTAQVGSFAVENTIFLLAQHYGTTTRCGTGNRFKHFYYADYDSTSGLYVPQRDMWACYRDADNTPGMYDLVNSVFYSNAAASGSFIKGPEIFPIIRGRKKFITGSTTTDRVLTIKHNLNTTSLVFIAELSNKSGVGANTVVNLIGGCGVLSEGTTSGGATLLSNFAGQERVNSSGNPAESVVAVTPTDANTITVDTFINMSSTNTYNYIVVDMS